MKTLDVQLYGCIMRGMEALLDDQVDAMFQALADRTRRDIVRRVMVEELSVSELAASYEMSFAGVQKHVAVLERAGIVSKQRVGRAQIAHVEMAAIRTVRSLLGELEDLWRARVARIDDLLADEEA
ncbi:MAG: ArsR/SmtB family transcription factor, partial [Brevibacterium aurantiacum]|uniref:ArsR/SmtB family transcription factor n=1 Tax=Brevibacterium aurantiacum TaxID=273384 RepID=UPI003F8F65B4